MFDAQLKIGTKVQLRGEYGFRIVSEVNKKQDIIKVEGLPCYFHKSQVTAYTNKKSVEMFPAVDDLYTTDQYGSVYERGDTTNLFVGKLNGKTLKQFIEEL